MSFFPHKIWTWQDSPNIYERLLRDNNLARFNEVIRTANLNEHINPSQAQQMSHSDLTYMITDITIDVMK